MQNLIGVSNEQLLDGMDKGPFHVSQKDIDSNRIEFLDSVYKTRENVHMIENKMIKDIEAHLGGYERTGLLDFDKEYSIGRLRRKEQWFDHEGYTAHMEKSKVELLSDLD